MPERSLRVILPRVALSGRLLLWLSLALLVALSDQWSKGLAGQHLDYGRPRQLLPFLDLSLQYNAGAAFGLLRDAGGVQRWLFSGFAAVASVVLTLWMSSLSRREWLLGIGLALILGGALGNLWDRLTLGYVVDFVSLHYRGRYFPTFNVADAAITLGAVLVLADSLRQTGGRAAGGRA